MNKGFTALELLLSACLVLVFIAGTTALLDKGLHAAQLTALKMELGGMRHSIYLYKILNSKYPSKLSDLILEGYILPLAERRPRPYYVSANMNLASNPMDPFGHMYDYNPNTGRVWSTSKGYETF
ncbi:MAG: hypothetical protein V1843_00790 [bacterium]